MRQNGKISKVEEEGDEPGVTRELVRGAYT